VGSDLLHTVVMAFADYHPQGCGSSTLHLLERVATTDDHGVMPGRRRTNAWGLAVYFAGC